MRQRLAIVDFVSVRAIASMANCQAVQPQNRFKPPPGCYLVRKQFVQPGECDAFLTRLAGGLPIQFRHNLPAHSTRDTRSIVNHSDGLAKYINSRNEIVTGELILQPNVADAVLPMGLPWQITGSSPIGIAA